MHDLFDAIRRGSLDDVKASLGYQRAASVDAANSSLWEWAKTGVTALVESGLNTANTILSAVDLGEAVRLAASLGDDVHVEMLDFLISTCGAPVDVANPTDDNTAVLIAAREGKLKALKCLLGHGATVGCTNRAGKNVLSIAPQVTDDTPDNIKHFLLHEAPFLVIQSGHSQTLADLVTVLKLDLKRSKNADGNLYEFIEKNDHRDAERLLAASYKLIEAAECGDVDTLKSYLDLGWTLKNVRNGAGDSLLVVASKRNQTAVIDLLISHGHGVMDFNAQDDAALVEYKKQHASGNTLAISELILAQQQGVFFLLFLVQKKQYNAVQKLIDVKPSCFTALSDRDKLTVLITLSEKSNAQEAQKLLSFLLQKINIDDIDVKAAASREGEVSSPGQTSKVLPKARFMLLAAALDKRQFAGMQELVRLYGDELKHNDWQKLLYPFIRLKDGKYNAELKQVLQWQQGKVSIEKMIAIIKTLLKLSVALNNAPMIHVLHELASTLDEPVFRNLYSKDELVVTVQNDAHEVLAALLKYNAVPDAQVFELLAVALNHNAAACVEVVFEHIKGELKGNKEDAVQNLILARVKGGRTFTADARTEERAINVQAANATSKLMILDIMHAFDLKKAKQLKGKRKQKIKAYIKCLQSYHAGATSLDNLICAALIFGKVDIAIELSVRDECKHMLTQQGARRMPPLLLAVELGCESAVKAFLQQHPKLKLLRKTLPNGMNALHLAAQEGHEAIVSYLLDNKLVDIDSTDSSHKTALAYAVIRNQINVVELLLSLSASPFIQQISQGSGESRIHVIKFVKEYDHDMIVRLGGRVPELYPKVIPEQARMQVAVTAEAVAARVPEAILDDKTGTGLHREQDKYEEAYDALVTKNSKTYENDFTHEMLQSVMQRLVALEGKLQQASDSIEKHQQADLQLSQALEAKAKLLKNPVSSHFYYTIMNGLETFFLGAKLQYTFEVKKTKAQRRMSQIVGVLEGLPGGIFLRLMAEGVSHFSQKRQARETEAIQRIDTLGTIHGISQFSEYVATQLTENNFISLQALSHSRLSQANNQTSAVEHAHAFAQQAVDAIKKFLKNEKNVNKDQPIVEQTLQAAQAQLSSMRGLGSIEEESDRKHVTEPVIRNPLFSEMLLRNMMREETPPAKKPASDSAATSAVVQNSRPSPEAAVAAASAPCFNHTIK